MNMSLNDVVSAERIHIAFFGMRNAGKSSLVNAVTNQNLSVVSDYSGTTTDPVRKAMELLPLGPVVIIDTPGFDDTGHLGQLRVEKTRSILKECDVAILVVDGNKGLQTLDNELIALFKEREIPYLVVYNKCDLQTKLDSHQIWVSAKNKTNIELLKERIGQLAKGKENHHPLVGDLVKPADRVILVVPVDSAAPKGRLILPQQMVIRDLLDHGACALVCQDDQLESLLDSVKDPKLVITDSQRFEKVAKIVPETLPLTSFSILMARYKGILAQAVQGAFYLDHLPEDAHILISEGCTHHRQCSDIGTQKLPNWIDQYTQKKVSYQFTSGREFPEDLSSFDCIIHCGGCMLNKKEMNQRNKQALEQGIAMTNYGTAIAHMHGILHRALACLEGKY